MNYPFRYGDQLGAAQRPRPASSVDAEFLLGVEPRRDGRTHKPGSTLDCSGADRRPRSLQGPARPARGHGDGSAAASSAIFDLDGDGDLDIVTSEFNAEPQVLVSDLAEQTEVRWLEVVLRGTRVEPRRPRRDGAGRGRRAGSHAATGRQVGLPVPELLPLYFGLGDATPVDGIEVRWPSGKSQQVPGADAPVGARIEITEGGAVRVVPRPVR